MRQPDKVAQVVRDSDGGGILGALDADAHGAFDSSEGSPRALTGRKTTSSQMGSSLCSPAMKAQGRGHPSE
jgi:hypothetical protein